MSIAMSATKIRQVLQLWALALVISAVLAAAGQRWVEPLPIRASLVWSLLLLPSLGMVVLLLGSWTLPVGPQANLADQGTESGSSIQEQE